MKKKCKYRNCKNIVPGKFDRPDMEFCCRNHKDMEYTYIKREKEKTKWKLLKDLTAEDVEILKKTKYHYKIGIYKNKEIR